MILRNMYLTFQSLLMCVDTLYVVSIGGTYPQFQNPQYMWAIGNQASGQYPSMYHVQTAYDSGKGGVVFGDGNTPVKWNDYKLSGNIISTIVTSANVTKETTETEIKVTGTYTITNTGENSITIREVGLMANSQSNKSSSDYAVLVERTVLDSPVTIEPGGVGQVTYTIRFNYPTA